MSCPNTGCQAQPAVKGDDGCGKELTDWLKTIEASLKKPQPKPGAKIVPDSERRKITMNQLPPDCRRVLDSPAATAVADDKAEPATTTAKK
jgi:penicillin-insensitive murein endopeptidase